MSDDVVIVKVVTNSHYHSPLGNYSVWSKCLHVAVYGQRYVVKYDYERYDSDYPCHEANARIRVVECSPARELVFTLDARSHYSRRDQSSDPTCWIKNYLFDELYNEHIDALIGSKLPWDTIIGDAVAYEIERNHS